VWFDGSAVAQETSGTATASPSAEMMEVIQVTARRRQENLQDTPAAISVLSDQALERQHIVSTTDLDRTIPNLQFKSYGTLTGNNAAAQVFIRGIGQTDATPAVDPGVGIYIDDVYMGRSVGGAMELRDIASVQVLRGPQGTLFGRNTIGGAVLLTTIKPGEQGGSNVRAATGSYALGEVYGALDIPIDDVWSARASGSYHRRDGYVTRIYDGVDLGNENTYAGQAALRFHPGDELDFILRADYSKSDENGSPFVFKAINSSQTFPAAASKAAGCPGATFPPPFVPGTADQRCANNSQYLGKFINGGTYPAMSTLENYGTSLNATWKLNDWLSLKSITAGRRLAWTGSRDADNTPLLILHTNYRSHSEQFSQEFQALVETDGWHGVVGAYFFTESSFDRLIVPLGNPGTSYDTQRIHLDTHAYAAFTEWTYDITPALNITGGIRYTQETKGMQGILFNVSPVTAAEPPAPSKLCPFGGPPPTQTGCLNISTNRFSKTFVSTTGSASAQYRWSPEVMTYFSWSQGFKSGGFNERYNAAPPGNVPISFNAEKASSFEFGFKTNPLPELRLNLALFWTSYDNIQLTYRLGVVPLLFNAGKATIKGGELEFDYNPIEPLQINGSVGYLENNFDSINNPPPFGPVTPTAVASLSSKLPFTPKWVVHAGVQYAVPVAETLSLVPRIDLSYTDSQYFDAGNSPEISQTDPVTVLAASLALEGREDHWRLALNVENLTNEVYPVAGTSSLTTSAGYAEVIYARPRTFTVSISKKF
jgi:iron complex outermembrane receptor protein